MLSKKMAFSLTSLITILALAFVATPAMAVDFKVTIEGPRVVTYATGAEATAIEIDLLVTSEEALPDTLAITADAAAATTAGNITVKARDIRGFETNILGDTTAPAITIADDAIGTFADRSVKLRQLSVSITPGAAPQTIDQITITIPAFETPDTRVGDDHDMSVKAEHTILVREEGDVNYDDDDAKVVSIQRLRPGSQTAVAAFQDQKISPEPFDIRIVLTEARFSRIDYADKTADELADELVKVDGGKATDLRRGIPFARAWVGDAVATPTAATDTTIKPHPDEGRYGSLITTTNALPGLTPLIPVPGPTGLDKMYHEYRVRITPQKRRADYTLKISVKGFSDYSPAFIDRKPNGREELRIPVAKDDIKIAAGYRVIIPKDIVIPKDGYLVIVLDAEQSQVVVPPGRRDRSPKDTERKPAQMLYNVYAAGNLPNLSSRFISGAVVDVEYGTPLVISEVMWGEDGSLLNPRGSQYIELYNPGDEHKTVDDNASTFDVDERLTLIFYESNEFNELPERAADGSLPDRVQDRIGTLDNTGKYWSPLTKGQNGASGTLLTDDADDEVTDIERTVALPANVIPIVSMYRVMETDGTIDAKNGQMEGSWMSSEDPKNANFQPAALGLRHGTPGAATDAIDTPADIAAREAEAEAEAEAASAVDVAMGDDIQITEIMVDTDSGRLPQWIELTSVAVGKVSLEGWEMVIDNAIDADVLGGGNAITVSLSGVILDVSAHEGNAGKGQSALVAAWGAQRMSDNISADRIVNVGAQLGQTRRYQLLSYNGFRITLVPPQTGAIAVFGDIAGNLDEDWELPMDGRSSIIRREMDAAGMAAMGTDEHGWVLASSTALITGQPSYYGDDEDNGTPGQDAGGPLPVELSHFQPARDKQTGAVVITWATQSELNNAGFFIKRSNQRNGEFKVINATMVAGAGTTSEKQFYTYTDTTAQPNIVYYYQIEDVSLDGNRQTLTRGIRLKGHIGAAGKLTSTWGELKSSNE